MKNLKPLVLIAVIAFFSACSSVRVASDYDQSADFTNYKTFAFFKPGIDEAEISDLDKKRILRAIETEMLAKGFVKSEDPSMLVSIFTTAQQRVDVYNNYGWGWGAWGPWGPWGPWGGGFGNTVSRTTEGTLYIDLIDASKKELVWQGQGTGYLARDVDRKQERISEIVGEIMQEYPPKQMASN
ncbi:DUF4136 domain-containing protein [Leeuwenhoekiella marinoflava]|uniref:DUF4136 domain-containing protein n=2 Tax=Leeuwenhoekiella marinoflava TaxID=988 RepID=A0A4Q0PJ27_9FLAO|nr:DUF4136 domain-containing protein [Leeuwenhoekiella marinoflava]RXG27360.1 putative protein DUF4136 [Leeuwenhoekiella marinoflava]SHF71461.1 protein of unknown function [Leeuwenhoekiella marinoflava DSM 3653]